MQNNNILHTDVFGQALLDYAHGDYYEDIITHLSLGEKDVMPLPYLFRNHANMPLLEQRALDLAKGSVLDVGCGSGSHSLYLQERGFEVTALDQSPGAVETCRIRGVKKVVLSEITAFSGMKFDTILLLMHGIGMAGKLSDLDRFLGHLMTLMNPGGQILLDSSDIIYMFDKDEDGGYWIPGDVAYYGEVQFITEYRGQMSEPFPWLYLDYKQLEMSAHNNFLTCEMVSNGQHFDYLARLTIPHTS